MRQARLKSIVVCKLETPAFQIRDRDAEKMSYVEKVVVILHETFPNPRRGERVVVVLTPACRS